MHRVRLAGRPPCHIRRSRTLLQVKLPSGLGQLAGVHQGQRQPMCLEPLSREGVLAGKNERVTDVHRVSSKWLIGVDLNDVQAIEVPNVNPFRVGDDVVHFQAMRRLS